MLATLKRASHGLWRYLSCVFILTCSVSAQPTQYDLRSAHGYYEYFMEYFHSIDEKSDIDEVIDNLIYMRQSIINQGLDCPTLRELCRRIMEYVYGHRFNVEDSALKEFIERVEMREVELSRAYGRPQIELVKHKSKHKHHKKDKELKMGSKGVFGFVKVLVGALTCLVPVPGAQTVGLGLIVLGVNEMIDDTREKGDETERQNKIEEQRRRESEALLEPALP